MSDKKDAKKEQENATRDINDMLKATRPKDLAEGTTSGLGTILMGAVGGCGAVVLAPVAGATIGAKKGGFVGGLTGFTAGTVIGVVGGVGAAVGGAAVGLFQIGRGIAAMPNAIAGKISGKWWDDVEGKWVSTNLKDEAEDLEKVPKDDKDLLGDAANEKPETANVTPGEVKVKDPSYYDALGVNYDAPQAKIKRQYYLLARQYHPDRAGDDREASKKFQEISEAFQVLSDPELRDKYNKEGKEGLSADRTSVAGRAALEPELLFAFLFGSYKFNDYVGRLAMATSALVEDDKEISQKTARKLQNRRCARLALKLAEKIDPWIDNEEETKKLWGEEIKELSTARFGTEMLHLIGMVYSLTATQFLGSLDSGIGMPSISKWAKAKKAGMIEQKVKRKTEIEGLRVAMNLSSIQEEAEKKMNDAKSEEEKVLIAEELIEKQMHATIQIMWTVMAVDITATLHQTCQMIFFDKSVDKKMHKKRGKAVLALGEMFLSIPPSKEENKNASDLLEEAAFDAMLETVKRKEEGSFRHSIS